MEALSGLLGLSGELLEWGFNLGKVGNGLSRAAHRLFFWVRPSGYGYNGQP